MNKLLFFALTSFLLLFLPQKNYGQAPNLGAAASFALFTNSGAFEVYQNPVLVTGNVGTNAGAFTGFTPGTPGVLIGAIVLPPASAPIAAAVSSASMQLAALQTGPGGILTGVLGNGQTLLPNVYFNGAATVLNGALFLDAADNPNAIFVIKIDGAFSTNANSSVTLLRGADLCNVYWYVTGAVHLSGTAFLGTIVAGGQVELLSGADLTGRALTTAGAIDLRGGNTVSLGLPTPAVITAGGATSICIGASVVLSSNISGIWNNGSNIASTSITVSTSGDYFITTTSGCGSINSNHIMVTVSPPPICTITGAVSICQGATTQLCAPTGLDSYSWSTGATTNCITVSTAATYTVTVTDNGCSSICSRTVTVNPLPACAITGPASVCQGSSIQLCVPAGSSAYSWSTGATANCITVSLAGTYTVTVTNNGCSSSCSKTITVVPLPVCTITGTSPICQGQSTQLCVPAGASSYLWSTGAATNCISVNATGTYSVTVTNAGGCNSICSKAVIVNPLPACSITGPAAICQGTSAQLCVPAGSSSYLWSTGATTNCITVSTAGTYGVTVTNNGCSTSCSKIITVNPAPACTITGNSPICQGQSTELCVPAGASSYLWSTGAITNCITVLATGTYSVTVSNGGGCSSICSKAVVVNPLPACSITGPAAICQGTSAQLCVPAGSSSYLWSTGATTNCITVSTSGTYSVTVTNSGCSTTCSKEVAVSPVPECTITGASSICEGASTQLCVPPGASSYLWSTGATTNCIVVNTSGTYSVTVTNSGCSNICSKAVTVHPLPACTITGPGSICQGLTAQLCAPAGSSGYLWSTGATTNCISVSTGGTYSVTVTNGGGCSSICSKTLTIDSPPTAAVISANGLTTFCIGNSVILSGNTNGIWNNGGGTATSITVTTSGDYFVTTSNACSTVVSNHIIIKVNPQPTPSIITANRAVTFCLGDSVVLSGNIGGTWNTGATTASITVKTSGEYFVTNSDTCGNVSSNHIIVKVDLPPTVSILTTNDSTTFCVLDSVIISGNVGGVWNTGATTSSITVKTSGDYFVTNANSCDTLISNHIVVKVDEQPVASIITSNRISDTICLGDSIILAGNVGGIWNNGSTSASIVVKTAGEYFVTNFNSCDTLQSNLIVVLVDSLLTFVIDLTDTICIGDELTLGTSSIAGHTYKWTTSTGTKVSTIANPIVRPTVTTTYILVETNIAGSCQATTPVKITVGPLPSCVIKGNNILCEGGSTEFCAPAGAFTYLWNTGDTSRCITIDSIGRYSVVVTNTFGCSSRCSRSVISGQGPCEITGNGFIYAGQSTQFCAPAGYASYKWSTGATTRCITASAAGTYGVTVTNSNGCISVCSKILTVSPSVDCEIIGDTIICIDGTSFLCAPDVPGNGYFWNTGAQTRCIEINCAGTFSVTVTNNGLYSYCEIVVKYGIPSTASLSSVSIAGNLNPKQGDSTTLSAPSGYLTYLWSNGATSQSIKVGSSGNYTVKVSNGGGCNRSTSVNVNYPSSRRSSPVITTGPVITKAPAQFEIKAYPNPFNSAANFEFQTNQSNSHIKIEVTGLAGNKIATLFDSNVEKGIVYKATLDGSQLSEGVYIYRIINGNQIISKKLVLIR